MKFRLKAGKTVPTIITITPITVLMLLLMINSLTKSIEPVSKLNSFVVKGELVEDAEWKNSRFKIIVGRKEAKLYYKKFPKVSARTLAKKLIRGAEVSFLVLKPSGIFSKIINYFFGKRYEIVALRIGEEVYVKPGDYNSQLQSEIRKEWMHRLLFILLPPVYLLIAHGYVDFKNRAYGLKLTEEELERITSKSPPRV